MSWIILVLSGVLEAVWATALGKSQGFTKLVPTIVFEVKLVVSKVLLAVALREIPVGTGYPVWTGIGAVGAVGKGMLWFGDPAAAGRIIPIGLIAIGIVWLALSD